MDSKYGTKIPLLRITINKFNVKYSVTRQDSMVQTLCKKMFLYVKIYLSNFHIFNFVWSIITSNIQTDRFIV